MIDIVFPKNNEKKFLRMAKLLGYSDLCFAYSEKMRKQSFTASFDDRSADLFLKRFDNTTSKRVDVMVDLEGSLVSNAFFKAAAEKNVLLALNFSAIIKAKNKARTINNVRRVIKLARKSKAKLLIASFADDIYLMRAPNDLQSFFCCFGLNPGEAKQAMNAAEERIEQNRKGAESGVKGIEIIE